MSLRNRIVLLSSTVALGVILSMPAAGHTRITTDVTWSEHIRDILRENCMVCHHPGGMAPDMADFTFYGTDIEPGAWAWRAAMEEEIITGRMPPWLPDERFGTFKNSRKLTEEEIDIIVAWVRGGGPQGPYQNLPVPEEFVNKTWTYGEPDLVFEMPEKVIPADQMQDSASHTFEVAIEEDSWITGYEFLPGNPESIYRISAYLHDPPGEIPPLEMEEQLPYDPLAEPEELITTVMRDMPEGPHFIGQWVRGDGPMLLPDAAGRLLRKGSKLEIHVDYDRPLYSDTWEEVVDVTKFGMYLAANANDIDLLVESLEIGSGDAVIPADASDFEARMEYEFEEDVHLLALNPVLGYLAKELKVFVHYPEGLSQLVLYIPEYKKLFSSTYVLGESIDAPAGTRIEFLAHFDNTSDNWDNPNSPPIDVPLGTGPDAEPFFALIDYRLDNHLKVEEPFVPREESETERRSSGMVLSGVPQGLLDPKGLEEQPETERDPLEQIAETGRQLLQEGRVKLAENGFHLLEGTMARPGEFRLTIYDPDMNPLDPRNFAGEISIEYEDGDVNEDAVPLVHHIPSNDYMSAWVKPNLPATVTAEVFLAGEPETFEWSIDTLTTEEDPEASDTRPSRPTIVQPPQGGWLHTIDDGYHRIEGTLMEPGEFKLYFYDNEMNPLDPRLFAAHVTDPETGEAIPLTFGSRGDEFLSAQVPETVPITFSVAVWIGGDRKTLEFEFDELTVEPWNLGGPEEEVGLARAPHGSMQFYEAKNEFNFVEGTMPRPGEFRAYFYDDWKNPVSPRNFDGRAYQRITKESGETELKEVEFGLFSEDDDYFSAYVSPNFPIELVTEIMIAGEENTFDFRFDGPVQDPATVVDTQMSHMDHQPVHGGWFFMADNMFHHVEGTMPSPGEFRMYFYDDYKQPIDPRNFSGSVFLPELNEETGELTEEEVQLVHANSDDEFLTARLGRNLPVTLYAKVWMGGDEKQFDFEFTELTKEPARSGAVPLTMTKRQDGQHSHQRDPLAIPDTVDGIVQAIRERQSALLWRIENEDWYGLYKSAYDARDLSRALVEDHIDALQPRDRGKVKLLQRAINRDANLLDMYGDLNDAPRVQEAHKDFTESLDELIGIYQPAQDSGI